MALDVISNITLNMQDDYPTSDIVHVNQYDSGLRVRASLLNGGEKWEVPSGAKAVVAFKKSDNIGGFYDVTDSEPNVQAVTVDSDRSVIYISLDTQTTTTPTPPIVPKRYVYMQVVFYLDGKRLSTFAFYMDVHLSAVNSKDITSNWVFNILAEEIASTLNAATTPDAMRAWLEENIKSTVRQGAYAIDNTLTLPLYAADAEATGKMVTVSDQNPNIVANKVWVKKTPAEIQIPTTDEFNELNSFTNNNIRNLAERNSFDIMAQTNKRSVEGRGIHMDLNPDGSFHVYGESEQTYFLTLYNDKTAFPLGMKAGGTYHLDYSATIVHFYFYIYKSDKPDEMVVLLNRYTGTDFTIPQDAIGAAIRLTVMGAGKIVDETVDPHIITAPSNQELNEKISVTDQELNEKIDIVNDGINTQMANYYTKIDGAYYGLFAAGMYDVPDIGGVIDTNRSSSSTGVVSAIIPCAEGDYVNLNISGAGTTVGGARGWAFCDENMTILSRANQGVLVDHEVLIAPSESHYVVVNTRQMLGYYAVVGLIQQESAWTGKTWYSYGTSMSDINPDGTTGNNGTSGKWPLVVDKLSGMIRHNGAIGSGGICPSLSHGGNVKAAILSTPWDVDLVTLEAGLNDWGKLPLGEFGDLSDDTFIGNFTQCIKYLVEHTRAKIVLVTMPCRTYTSSEQTARYDPFLISAYGYSYRDLLDLEIAVCQIYGVEVIDTAANVPMDFRNKATVRDFVHFTDLGGTIYGNYIWSKLKNMQPCPVVFAETDYV